MAEFIRKPKEKTTRTGAAVAEKPEKPKATPPSDEDKTVHVDRDDLGLPSDATLHTERLPEADPDATMLTDNLPEADHDPDATMMTDNLPEADHDPDATMMTDNLPEADHDPDATMMTDNLPEADATMVTEPARGARNPQNTARTEQMAQEPNAKYQIVKSLGRGGFAWVYLVRNLDLDRLEAMKILNAELNEDPDVIERFVKEARISANFNHQNIITIFEVKQQGSWQDFVAEKKIITRHREPFAYFTMSFVEGVTATNLIKKQGKITQIEAISIIGDACSALEYAHGEGVVHRDIKPENIMVDRKQRGIVMDFGIAKVIDQTRQTAAGTFMGTARYVSPEQAKGGEIDGRSDIYSLGITLYELVTGRVPFDSDQWMTVLYQHIHETPPPPEQFCQDINRNLRAIILKMLAKQPGERYQTAREVRESLAAVYRQLGGKDVQTASLDNIPTRHDYMQGNQTSATEVMGKDPAARPPVGRGPKQFPPAGRVAGKGATRQAPAQTDSTSKGSAGKWLALVAVLAVLGGLAWLLWLRPAPTPEPTPTPVAATGRLLVTAFPRGELIKVTDSQGQTVDVANTALPQFLELPEGNYTLIFNYRGRTAEETVYVSPDLPLVKVNTAFEVEDEAFLLEDMR